MENEIEKGKLFGENQRLKREKERFVSWMVRLNEKFGESVVKKEIEEYEREKKLIDEKN